MDNVDETVAELTAKFRAMGADDPESWAASEIQEDIPQLGRFLFLRNIWPNLIDTWTADVSWVERLSQAEDEPFADAWLALKRSREAGVEDEDISRIARWVAYETVFGLLYHMADPQNESPEGMQFPGWELMETTEDDGPVTGRPISMLFEDLLSMDPSGREGSSESID